MSLEALVKLLEVGCVEEVDEAITYIALILDIAGQVEEVISIGQLPIDLLRKLLDGVLIGYVPDHDGSPGIGSYVFWKNSEHGTIIVGLVPVVIVIVWGVVGVFIVVEGLDVDCTSVTFGN